jgi:glyoxylase I family protein
MRFYKDALGFTERHAWGEGERRAALLDSGDGNYLEVFAGGKDEPPSGGAILHLAFRTADVDAAIERVRAAGAQVTAEPKDVTLGRGPEGVPARIAFCRGPGGEEIEFFQNELT